jgi:TolB-like protein
VATGEAPVILWMEHAVRGGEDRPGPLALGVLQRPEQVRDEVLARLLRSLDDALRGARQGGPGCSAGRSYTPRIRFRSAFLEDGRQRTVAIVPFLNQSSRRNAGDLVALEFVRQLARTGRYRVLEPGVVRDYMLRARVMIPGGVSLETTRLFLGALGVDLVVSGAVLDYLESGGTQGPTIRFSATMLDGDSGQLVWQSTSFNRGDDGVFFFGLGRVRTAGELTCRMVAAVVDRMGRHSKTVTPPQRGVDIGPGSRIGQPQGDPTRQ